MHKNILFAGAILLLAPVIYGQSYNNPARMRPVTTTGFTNPALAVDGLLGTSAYAVSPNNAKFITIALPWDYTLTAATIYFGQYKPSNVVVYGAPKGSTSYVRLGKSTTMADVVSVTLAATYSANIKVVINDDGAASTPYNVSIKEIELTGKTKAAFQLNYDAAGNRIETKLITLATPKSALITDSAAIVPDTVGYNDTPATGTDIFSETLGLRTISLYPNPLKQELSIDISENGTGTLAIVEVFDMAGKRIKSLKTISKTTKVDFSMYPAAMYIVHIKADGQISEWKVVKE